MAPTDIKHGANRHPTSMMGGFTIELRDGRPPEDTAAGEGAPMQGPHSGGHTHVGVSIVHPQLVSLVSHQQQCVSAALGKVGQGRGKGQGCGAGPWSQGPWA